MKVLILGMPRTGTQSLADALEVLGIGPTYHMREVGKNKHQALWIEALDAKFDGKGEQQPPLDRERFDQMLGGYEALADYPAAIFPTELMAAYPEAAIILTVRPVASWMASMSSTLIHAHLAAPDPDPNSSPSPMRPLAERYHRFCWGDDFAANGREVFARHNEEVRRAAAACSGGEEGKGGEGEGGGGERRFLEYETGSGWGPLCEFLGVEVPRAEFPRSDDWVEYKKMVKEKERESGK